MATLDLDGAIAAVADSTGAFRLTDVPWGAHRLEARRLGYRPASLDLELTPDDPPTDIGIALVPLPVELPAAEVSAEAAPDVVPRLRAFERRKVRSEPGVDGRIRDDPSSPLVDRHARVGSVACENAYSPPAKSMRGRSLAVPRIEPSGSSCADAARAKQARRTPTGARDAGRAILVGGFQ